jgi:tetratricopeptide (TPR) repeat protein
LRHTATLTLVVLLGAASMLDTGRGVLHAQAQESPDDRARRLYQAGEAAFDEGEFEVSLRLLRSAYQLSPRPALLYNMAICADRLRRDQEALQLYDEFLERVPDSATRASVEARARALREALARSEQATPLPPVAEGVSSSDDVAARPREIEASEVQPGAGGSDPTEEPWFWPVFGAGLALIIGGVVGVVVGVQPADQPYRTGDIGGVVFALEIAP